MEENTNAVSGFSNWQLALIFSALLSGAGSGVIGLTQDTTDRYKGQDARRDFALRDERITEIRRDLEAHIRSCDAKHRDFEERLRELEREHHQHEEGRRYP